MLEEIAFGKAPIEEPVAVVVAHPDDETIGAGARLARFRRLTLVHLTDGAPRDPRDAAAAGFSTRQAYAAARRRELKAALEVGGVTPERVLMLEFADQEAALDIRKIAERLDDLISTHRVKAVLTHAYEGGHPDHDAAACAVARVRPPIVVEMAGYNALDVGSFLGEQGVEAVLSPAEQDVKRRMLDCFASQQRVLAMFRTEVERFRLAPTYDFGRPPHDGPLWYEGRGWPIDGARWRELAAC